MHMQSLNGQNKETNLKPTIETSPRKSLRWVKVIFIFVVGVLTAKSMFFFLDRPRAKTVAENKKIEPKKVDTVSESIASKTPPVSPIETASKLIDVARKQPRPELSLSGIASSGALGWAVINGRVIKLGGKINGAQVVGIYKDRVDLKFEGKIFSIRIK